MVRSDPAKAPPARFGTALALIVATIVSLPVADLGRWGRRVSVTLAGCTLLFILHTSQAKTATQGTALVVGRSPSSAAAEPTAGGSNRLSAGAPSFVGAVLAIAAPVAIVRRLLSETSITGQTIAGAVHPPFFAQASSERTVDHVYF